MTRPLKYLDFLHQQQKQLQYFFQNILLKHYQLPIFGTLEMLSHFHQK